MSFPVYFLSTFADSNFYINQHHNAIPMHSHNYIELVFVPKGRARSLIEQDECEIYEGCYFFVDYNTSHAYTKLTDDFYVMNCLFEPQFIDSAFTVAETFNEICKQYTSKTLKACLKEPISNRVFMSDNNIKLLFEKIWNEQKQKNCGYDEIIRSAICEIIIRTIRKLGCSPRLNPVTTYIIENIQNRYRKPLTLKSLCEELHFTPSYVSAIFHKDTNLTFTQYLQITRIQEACNMLILTNQPITAIADAVGYSSIKAFNTIFKSITKTTPREYRKNRK